MNYPNAIITTAIRRAIAPYVIIGITSMSAFAQSNSTSSNTSSTNQSDAAVRMSAFEVRSTQGTGYSEGNAATALKSSQSLMDLPQQIIVVSADFIRDVGTIKGSSDILQYVGLAEYYRGENGNMVRGQAVQNPYIDDVPDGVPYGDPIYIDSIEVIKGPVQVMYPQATLGGTILKSTKKPLPVTMNTLTLWVDQWGGERLTVDLTGPLSKIGEGRLSYRVAAAFQGGTQYFHNYRDSHTAVFPVLEYDYKGTSVRISYNWQRVYGPPGGTGLLTPTGSLYVGGGRREIYIPANDTQEFSRADVHGTWIQKISDSWEMKLEMAQDDWRRHGVGTYAGTVNWNALTLTYNPYIDDTFNSNFVVQEDFTGKYSIAGLPNQSSFGGNYSENTGTSRNWKTNFNPTIVTALTAASVDSIQLPVANSNYWQPSTPPAGRRKTLVDTVYYMHQIDPIPNWLTLVGGFTYSGSDAFRVSNTAQPAPFTGATELNAHTYLHRLAAIIHLTKEIMIYGLDSTTFSAASGVDYFNNPLPPVEGEDREMGLKTDFLNGRLSSTISVFDMKLKNQAKAPTLQGSANLNVAGQNYLIPIGSTTTKGWDAIASFQITADWQVIATAYSGTVRDEKGNPLSQTYENSWSAFTRYNFGKETPLKGLAIGGGIARIGCRWFSMGGLVLPGNAPLPVDSSGNSLFKLHEGSMVDMFVSYRLNRRIEVRVSCENVLDEAFPMGAQAAGVAESSDPRTFSFGATYTF